MMLMPDDEVHFHFELTDNDNVSGPKMTISNTLIAKVPSLADLYDEMENSENNLAEEIIAELNDIESLKNQIENTNNLLLLAKKINQSIKKNIVENVQ